MQLGNRLKKKTFCLALSAIAGATLFSQIPQSGAQTQDTAANRGDARQIYSAQFNALNTSVTQGFPGGTGQFLIDGDRFGITDSLIALDPGIPHLAFVFSGNKCPTLSDDFNGDGVIDVIEGVAAYGGILVPLDGDLASRGAGSDFFPTADSKGNSDYIQSTTLAQVLADANLPVAAEVDGQATGQVSLGGKALDLETRTVVIHGISPNTALPDTVASIGGLPATTTVPVACSTIVKTAPTPSPSPSASPSPSVTPSPSPSPSPSPTVSPSPSPTSSPITPVTVNIPAGSVGKGTAAYGVNPLVIPAGTTVTWVNQDSLPHTVTSDNGLFDSGTLQPGQSFSFTFKDAGKFGYFCAIHGAASMSGGVEVSG